jgi:hypothetical protein
MPSHDYSPRVALEMLIRKVTERDPELASHLQSAIDAGKDVSERQYSPNRKRSRLYRKTVRFTDEEALRIAIEALQAHFVEQPMFVISAARQFAAAALGDRVDASPIVRAESPKAVATEGVGVEKPLEIEVQTETQISRADEQTIRLTPPAADALKQQQEHVGRLLELTRFEEG